jgi:hypothetical protein
VRLRERERETERRMRIVNGKFNLTLFVNAHFLIVAIAIIKWHIKSQPERRKVQWL